MFSRATVMKFGGTSVQDAPAFARVAGIVRAQAHARPVVVVSAMSGVTDGLINSLRTATRAGAVAAVRSLEAHIERHLNVAEGLGTARRARMQMLLDEARQDIFELLSDAANWGIATSPHHDRIVSHGERLSAHLLTMILEEYGLPATYVDARHCIQTNADFGNAKPVPHETTRRTRTELKPLLAVDRIPVLGGFIGATTKGRTTTMGRGASDYTATLISAALRARETQIWTDVDGVQTADPSLVKSARTVSQLSYAEAAELARLGARVLHPKMFQPVLGPRIPIRIFNSRAPEQSGTLICASVKASPQAVKAIAHRTNLTRIDIASTLGWLANGFLHAIQKIFRRHRRPMELVGISEKMVSFACDDLGVRSPLVMDLREIGSVRIRRDRAMVSCVGEGLLSAPRSARRVLRIAGDIDSRLAWRSSSIINLMSMVKADSVGPIVRQLHQGIFESNGPGA